jgi:hypothetical protein
MPRMCLHSSCCVPSLHTLVLYRHFCPMSDAVSTCLLLLAYDLFHCLVPSTLTSFWHSSCCVFVKSSKPLRPVVLYWCETWFLTLREEHRLRVFENRVLRRIFGPKRDEMMGEWRKLHNKELHDLYSSPSIIRIMKSRRMRWSSHVARMVRRESHIDYWWESQRERDH